MQLHEESSARPLVQLEVPVTADGAGNPWLDTFGRSAADPDFDALLDMKVVTRNKKHFGRVPDLLIEDWTI